jgi:uncharacterized glyoxalase superfamily protein PhnB
MFDGTVDTTRAVVSVVAYRNIVAMVDWLCNAFGFEKQLLIKGENGEVKHAQLAFGESIIMVVPVEGSAFERLVVHPEQTGGAETQTCYLVVTDVEAHHARAKTNGAEIIFGIRVETYGGRGYASRDPEGHVWVFGTYDPRKHRPAVADRDQGKSARGWRASTLTAACLAMALVASTSAVVWTYHGETRRSQHQLDGGGESARASEATERDLKRLATKLAEAAGARERAERNAAALLEELTINRTAHENAVRSGKQSRDQLALEVKLRDSAAQAAKQAADQLDRERLARHAAEKLARDATEQLDRMLLAKVAAERFAKESADRAERERVACSHTERAGQDAVARLVRERNARAAAELATSELRTQLFASDVAPQQQIVALQGEIDAERHARKALERAASDAQLLLAQEKHSRDAAERALKQAHQQPPASCWSCPSATPCGPQ